MCIDSDFTGHKVQVCQVGDLQTGQRYRLPAGDEVIVTDLPDGRDGYTRVVDLATGRAYSATNSTRLGRDRAGRLYASRSLNAPSAADTPAVADAPPAANDSGSEPLPGIDY